MKHSLLFTAIMIWSGSALIHAQTPQNKKHTVVFDFSDTWCGPCGAYGVAIADTVDRKLTEGDKGYLIGIKGSFSPSSPPSINAMGAGSMFDNFNLQGVPTFMVNNIEANAPTGNNASDITEIMAAATTFNATPAVASAAGNVSISGSVLTVSAKTKFWSAATGEYYMTAFLAEDKIIAAQNQNSATTVHPHVLKGAMSTTGTALVATPFGEQIGTTSIAANTEFSKTYTVNIDATWKKENLEVYIIIFKKNGSKYEYVNAEKAKSSTTGIGTIAHLEHAVLYPNPTGNTASLTLTLTERMKVDLTVTDVLGRTVYAAPFVLNAGENTVVIPSDRFANGTYDINISAGNQGQMTKKLVVNK
jgi:hypothetical protein